MKTETPILTKARRDPYAEREKRFRKWYGWRAHNGKGAICPRRVAGKHCLLANSPDFECICLGGGANPWDHCALWKDKEGQLVFTSEPYWLTFEALAKKMRHLAPLGLEATILPRSGWNPDHTILLVITKSDERIITHHYYT